MSQAGPAPRERDPSRPYSLMYNPSMAQSTLRSKDSRSKTALEQTRSGSTARFAQIEQKVMPILKPYVKRISVFGSFARGEETAESDIDLLVALKPSHLRPALGLFEVIRLEQELKKELGREVDLVTE
jgi:predicted nucleotidyltransferase